MGSCAPIAVPAPDKETLTSSPQIATTTSATKRKNRLLLAGTPDPETEVVSLSPRTLLEQPYWHACELCGQVFRREQNLELHRRAHGLPSKHRKRGTPAPPQKKRVFVCPEPSCLHHHPAHALVDKSGIKNHFRRKHGGHRQWVCARCPKAYAVLSDYKAHARTCGTRAGHSTCHCGRVFTRVVTFVEHQGTCSAGRPQAGVGPDMSSPQACGEGKESVAAASSPPAQQQGSSVSIVTSAVAVCSPAAPAFYWFLGKGPTPPSGTHGGGLHNLELQLMTPSCYDAAMRSTEVPI